MRTPSALSRTALAGGLRAVEHLRQVFAELHAVTVRDTVSFHMHGRSSTRMACRMTVKGAARAAHVMLDQLTWWAEALTDARGRRPYGAAAREAAA